MNKNKIWVTQIIRHIIQIISFIVFPGLFILTLSSIETIIKTLIVGSISFSSLLYPLFVLLAIIPITILWGRFFCGYLCAFGSMQELVNYIARKLKIKQIKMKPETDRFLKAFKYIVLLILILLWIFNLPIDTLSPWNVFGIYSSYKGWTDLSSLLSIGGVLLFIIIVTSIFIERAFCRYLCPLGGIFNVVSKPRLYKIKKNSKCVNCNLCSNKCPMGIDVNKETSEFGKVKSGECIDCFKCIDNCNLEALYTNPKEAISGTAAAIAISGLYLVGTIPTNTSVSGLETEASITARKIYRWNL